MSEEVGLPHVHRDARVPTTGRRFARAGEILADSLELEPPARAAFVSAATAGEPELQALVGEMLRAAELSGTFLDGAVPGEQVREMAARMARSDPGGRESDREEDRVAGYEIVEPLGAGGFGTVWLARQLRPVRRDVALKVLKPGMDTRDIVARFEHERQALARMSHENVARVLDAGVTETGRPYFAMELVRGKPITRHCDDDRLGVRARLRLFVEACRGVQHAHQRGIIHRDIKPSNVLVTTEGGRAIPKVIDFGIAKAIEGDPEDRLVRTRHDEVLGTPAYMSPEQATPGAVADTRTDVYSLGVLLHELLTGLLPFDRGALSRISPSSGVRALHDADAPRPSGRLASQQSLAAIAHARATEPAALRREIRGDLDAIVMTAMASEPERRYPSVDALVADVERHLEHVPVEARPPSALYRLGKFTRKHRFGVSAAAIGLVLLVAGLLGTSYGFAAATRARAVAEERRERAEEQAYSGAMLLAEQAIRSRRLEAARALLDEAPERLRGWEWSHLASRLDADVEVMVPPGPNVYCVLGSRDGTRCWTWDGTRLDCFPGARGSAAASCAIPGLGLGGWIWEEADGAILASGEPGRVVRVSAQGSSMAVRDLPSIDPPITGVAYDVATARMYWSDGAGVVCSRPADGGPVRRGAKLPSVRDRNLSVTPDGAWLIATGRRDLEVIDAATLEVVHVMPWPAGRELSKATLSSDQALLAMGYSDGTVELRDFHPTGPALRDELTSEPAWVTDLDFSMDGRRLAASYGSGSVRTWDVASGRLEDALAQADIVNAVAFAGPRLVLATGASGALSWRPGGDAHRRLRGHVSYVYAVTVMAGGATAVSGGWDARAGAAGLKVWDVASRRMVASWGGGGELIGSVATAGDCLWAASSVYPDASVRAFDARTGELSASFAFPRRVAVSVVALDSRRAVALLSRDASGDAVLLDAETGESRSLPDAGLAWSSETDRAAAASPGGRWIALSWGRGGIQVLDGRTGAVVARRMAHEVSAWSLTFSPDGGKVASASDDGTVAVWSVPSLEIVHRLRGSGSPVLCVAWSPDGRRIAAGTRDGGIDLWDPARGLLVSRLTGHGSYVKSLAWTPDGRSLLSASGDHDIGAWDSLSAGDVTAAASERDALLERLAPIVGDRLAASRDAGAVARWIDESPDLSRRERQVAGQELLRRGLEAAR